MLFAPLIFVKIINRFIGIARDVSASLAMMALFAMMVMTFSDVMLRSVFNSPIEAATELTRIFMAIVVFATLPIVSEKGEHISVDLLDRFFSGWAARVRDSVMSLLCGAMLFLPADRIVTLTHRAKDYGDVTEYLGIPQYYVSAGIAFATYVTAVVLVVRGLLILFARSSSND